MGGSRAIAVRSSLMVRSEEPSVAISIASYGTVQHGQERLHKSVANRRFVPTLAVATLMVVGVVSLSRTSIASENLQELFATRNVKTSASILKDLQRLTQQSKTQEL